MRRFRTTIKLLLTPLFYLFYIVDPVLAAGDDPAELPPGDYNKNYYNDSRGCVFSRGDLDGKTLWLPRLTRDRQRVCITAGNATITADKVVSVVPTAQFERSAKTVLAIAPEQTQPERTNKTVALTPADVPDNMPMGYVTAWQTQPVARCGTTTGRAPTDPRALYIQVATFSVTANAHRTATRLEAMGLPVLIKHQTKKSKVYCAVLSGPFKRKSDLVAALRTARKAGFKDAFTQR